MTLAEEFARLVKTNEFHPIPGMPGDWQVKKHSRRTRTVYSVGEALTCKEQSGDAKLAPSSI